MDNDPEIIGRIEYRDGKPHCKSLIIWEDGEEDLDEFLNKVDVLIESRSEQIGIREIGKRFVFVGYPEKEIDPEELRVEVRITKGKKLCSPWEYFEEKER